MHQKTDVPYRKHLYSLDALRGIAAVVVVLWHWHHFFYHGTVLDAGWDPKRLPLFFLFGGAYRAGWRAVGLFFCLSGFIFTWLYADPIKERKISWREFAWLRFSRLYPLHLVTLGAVALGQRWLWHRRGYFFVVATNDARHFGLQLFLASNWMREIYSFNAPIWSVSIEILLYAAFFGLCANRLFRWPVLLLLAAAGPALFDRSSNRDLGVGVFSFFIGSMSYWAFEAIRRHPRRRLLLGLLTGATVIMFVTLPDNRFDLRLFHLYQVTGLQRTLGHAGRDLIGGIILGTGKYSITFVLFPLLVVTLALWESSIRRPLAFLSHVGNISYSSYLIHFPLQLAVFVLVTHFGIGTNVFYRPDVLAGFLLVLIALSTLSYRWFERPMQRWLRSLMTRGSPRPAGGAAPS